ncbi:histidine kinase dimerization/phosphoacceptor domain -containing protein [Winogradskyella psychrotolerans]|uniref:histidine kinase dimerization/phosphoacceptor domain -containing protein n=1 Tax=Winogradskyella psychrotolerans TaxID=1344585 RepID=UPI001C0736D8|nr:histidine kinase dimerization/phosphoacceptor domain -containing protein [Winogradskyella psychrotolerans]MBU2926987.1 tetratricopeptide repeat protein [Winogradskyella psychrotolerans]
MKYLVVLLFFSNIIFCQDDVKQQIDSLMVIEDSVNLSHFKNLLRTIDQLPSEASFANYNYIETKIDRNDTLKLYLYLYKTSTLLRQGKADEALLLNTKGLNLLKQHHIPLSLYEFYQMRANVFDNKAIIDSTVIYINKAEEVINDNIETLGQYLTRIYHQRAMVEQTIGNFEKEDYYMEKVADVIESYPESSGNAFSLSMVVYHFKKRKNYAKHAYYSQKLQEYYLKKDGFNTPKSHESIASMVKMDNTTEQIRELKHIISTRDSLQYNFLLPSTSNLLGDIYLESKNYDEAIFYLKKSLNYNKENINPYSKLITYNLLYQTYYDTKNYDKAIEALNKKIDIQNRIKQEELIEKVADFEVKYETEKKTVQLKLLQAENEYKEEQKQWYLILAFSGLIATSLLGYFAYRNSKQKLILSKQKDQLEVTIDERDILFKEIHHRVKNSLQMVSSLLFLQSQNIENSDAKNAIKDAQNRVRSLSLIHQKLYSKQHLIGVETKDYISELTQDIFYSHQLESQDLDFQLDVENLVLDIDTLTPIGLILNELIVNVLKHAFTPSGKNHKLSIQFKKTGKTLVLKVIDNGIGYKEPSKKNSFGLKLINSLAKKLDATFTIKSIDPTGTEAVLIINDFEIIPNS